MLMAVTMTTRLLVFIMMTIPLALSRPALSDDELSMSPTPPPSPKLAMSGDELSVSPTPPPSPKLAMGGEESSVSRTPPPSPRLAMGGDELSVPPTPPPSPKLANAWELSHKVPPSPKLAMNGDLAETPKRPRQMPILTALSCTTMLPELAPCLSFLTSKNSSPSARCCSGVEDIASKAKTKNNRQAICECIKGALANVSYQPSLITVLPEKCGAAIILPPIDENTDCSTATNDLRGY